MSHQSHHTVLSHPIRMHDGRVHFDLLYVDWWYQPLRFSLLDADKSNFLLWNNKLNQMYLDPLPDPEAPPAGVLSGVHLVSLPIVGPRCQVTSCVQRCVTVGPATHSWCQTSSHGYVPSSVLHRMLLTSNKLDFCKLQAHRTHHTRPPVLTVLKGCLLQKDCT